MTKDLDLDLKNMQLTELADKILSETSQNESKELMDLFNWFLSKKHVARVAKLNNLYDSITDQMILRFSSKPDQFSNDDLINYMKAVQSAIDTTSKSISDIDQPPQIIQNNMQINVSAIGAEGLNRESRNRILEAIQKTLANASSDTDNEIIESEGYEEI